MIKYILGITAMFLLYRVETTGNHKLIVGAFISYIFFSILYIVDIMKEMI